MGIGLCQPERAGFGMASREGGSLEEAMHLASMRNRFGGTP
jgi:hypothetical protein